MKLSELILMSDVDGTLVAFGESIPRRNIDAVRRFVDKGGRFGIATGRSELYAADIASQLAVNLPCIFINGSVIYDLQSREYLMQLFLPGEARGYADQIMARFPGMGVMVVNAGRYHDVTSERSISQYSRSSTNKYISTSAIDQVPQPWYKLIFVVEAAQSAEFHQYLDAQEFPGVRFVYTSHVMCEMIPAQSSKGNALEQLLKRTGHSREQLVAVGDYHNDLEMLRLAGFSAAPPEAPEEVRAEADLILGPCSQGSVADLIEHLEEKCRE